MSERSPLLTYRLVSMSTEVEAAGGGPSKGKGGRRKKLSTFFGVVVPTLLSMFSVVLFLRIGFAVGQAGLYETVAMFVVAYIIIVMTVLAVCAISTNGALDAGGAYYMISRALGPEFGGSIGMMFFLGNACASALFILGLVEAVVDTFGIPIGETVGTGVQILPRSYWYEFLYGSAILLLCLVICLVGASIYAKANFIIFLIVIIVLCTVFISFFAVSPKNIPLHVTTGNITRLVNGSFTGFKLSTLMENLYPRYSPDYTTGRMMTFTTVFAVMFNGCTGIMAGSNISGDLKNPSYSIPRGTITAVIFTYIIYNLLSLMVSCTCDRTLLLNNYSFMRDFNVWHPFVTIGIYASMISASMSNLIGASRILYALAKDDLFDADVDTHFINFAESFTDDLLNAIDHNSEASSPSLPRVNVRQRVRQLPDSDSDASQNENVVVQEASQIQTTVQTHDHRRHRLQQFFRRRRRPGQRRSNNEVDNTASAVELKLLKIHRLQGKDIRVIKRKIISMTDDVSGINKSLKDISAHMDDANEKSAEKLDRIAAAIEKMCTNMHAQSSQHSRSVHQTVLAIQNCSRVMNKIGMQTAQLIRNAVTLQKGLSKCCSNISKGMSALMPSNDKLNNVSMLDMSVEEDCTSSYVDGPMEGSSGKNVERRSMRSNVNATIMNMTPEKVANKTVRVRGKKK